MMGSTDAGLQFLVNFSLSFLWIDTIFTSLFHSFKIICFVSYIWKVITKALELKKHTNF